MFVSIIILRFSWLFSFLITDFILFISKIIFMMSSESNIVSFLKISSKMILGVLSVHFFITYWLLSSLFFTFLISFYFSTKTKLKPKLPIFNWYLCQKKDKILWKYSISKRIEENMLDVLLFTQKLEEDFTIRSMKQAI